MLTGTCLKSFQRLEGVALAKFKKYTAYSYVDLNKVTCLRLLKPLSCFALNPTNFCWLTHPPPPSFSAEHQVVSWCGLFEGCSRSPWHPKRQMQGHNRVRAIEANILLDACITPVPYLFFMKSACGSSFCFKCGEDAHEPASCEFLTRCEHEHDGH
jgi:hypothetical protein